MKKDCIVVIPARYAAARFPGKVLAPLGGRPVLQWCYEAAVASGIGRVLVATEDEKVAEAARLMGAEAVITSHRCASGSDRVHEAVRKRKESIVINLQADEPFIRPATLKAVARRLHDDEGTDIATACAPIRDRRKVSDPNCVKIAMNGRGRALYFSRSPIPFHHPLSELSAKTGWFQHCGLYGYRRLALEKFISLPPSPLERLERLEQLRALEAGMSISVVTVPELGPAIDVPGDLVRAGKYLKNRKL